MVRLGLEVIRYDAHFGNGSERPDTVGALRHEADEMLAGPEPWMWLAERDGQAIGLLAAQRPELAGWIAPLVRQAPVAYLMLMFVAPGERASGIGAELVARLHADIRRGRCAGHAAALRAGEPAVRAVLEPAGLPPAVARLGSQARPRHPLTRAAAGRPPRRPVSCPGRRSPAGC